MKKHAIVFTISILLFSGLSLRFRAQSQTSDSNYASDQIIVKMKPDSVVETDQSQIADLALPSRGESAESLGGDRMFLVHLKQGQSVEDALIEARSNPRVEYAEPDYLLHTTATPNDSFFNLQWGLFNNGDNFGKAGADIAATQTWDITQGSSDIVVAVTDTGLDLTHPDLAANIWTNPGETADNGVDDDDNGFIDDINGWNFVDKNNNPGPGTDFHGTHVSGIIGASGNNGLGVSGVAWRVKLMALKFISGLEGKTSGAIKAIKYATDMRRKGINVRVINASWGGDEDSESLREAIQSATSAGLLFVCAAGNGGDDRLGDNNDETPFYPSDLSRQNPSVISVAALDRSDNLASFSNYGHESVSLGAPGVAVLSTVPGGGYGQSNGTSMATPHVSGIAVLLWSREPGLTAAQIKQRIVSRSVPITSLASIVDNSARANALNAVTDTAPPAPALGIGEIETGKKVLTVNGLGFRKNSTVISVNGIVLSNIKYPNDYQLEDGTLTRMTVKLGKSQMNALFPRLVQVRVEVYEPMTDERAMVTFIRP
jgi:subtilisin family serine protease